jgi:hypothetical protein|tara:strand:- start:386 stop:529 length:144 start_codon:yes stop_codon:yes gene_type:complete
MQLLVSKPFLVAYPIKINMSTPDIPVNLEKDDMGAHEMERKSYMDIL